MANMTSLKRHFLQKFPTDFAQIFRERVKLVYNSGDPRAPQREKGYFRSAGVRLFLCRLGYLSISVDCFLTAKRFGLWKKYPPHRGARV